MLLTLGRALLRRANVEVIVYFFVIDKVLVLFLIFLICLLDRICYLVPLRVPVTSFYPI